MKKQITKSLIIVMIFTILTLIFVPKIAYGYTSVNLEDYKPNMPSSSLTNSNGNVIENKGPIISMKSKVISFVFILIITALIYFIPTIIALVRHHSYKLYIIGINIILGWTLIGWIVCLIWSFIDNRIIKE